MPRVVVSLIGRPLSHGLQKLIGSHDRTGGRKPPGIQSAAASKAREKEDAMELLTNPEAWIALLTLTVLEIVLGIDNVIFISILVGKLPESQRDRARYVGLGLAMGMRILLLLTISWIVGLTAPVLTIAGNEFSWRDLILISGGLFLLWKASTEIFESLEGEAGHASDPSSVGGTARFGPTIIQIVLLDI